MTVPARLDDLDDAPDPLRRPLVPSAGPVELVPEGVPRLGDRASIGARRAFVVDTSESAVAIRATILQIHGFEVQTFASPGAAMVRSRGRIPDVVVMEPQSLGGADPLDVLAAWSDLLGDAMPPVIWCTTAVPETDRLGPAADCGLRGVVIKPFRLEALAALVVRICRRVERERRLRKLGVDITDVGAVMSPEVTRMWLDVEVELAAAHGRPLSLVAVGSSSSAAIDQVRGVIRAVDLVALADAQTLLVLLPEVGDEGAEVVAEKIAEAVHGLTPRPAVIALPWQPGESGAAFLDRASAVVRPD